MSEPSDPRQNAGESHTLESTAGPQNDQFAAPGKQSAEYTDGRRLGEWKTTYPKEARQCINNEAFFLAGLLITLCLVSGILLGLSGQTVAIPVDFLKATDTPAPTLKIDVRVLTLFFVGCLGGTTFSVKWLIHSVAKSKWHLDRRYWRLFVPLIGGVYACVVLTLFESGLIGTHGGQPRDMGMTAAYAFLVGYFSDGVSGLLSNIANAVFGTLEKK